MWRFALRWCLRACRLTLVRFLTVVFFFAKAGLVTARFLWRSFRYAFLLIFIAAAVITPTGDMVTQTIFAAPMVALYLLSIAIAWMFGRVKSVRESA